MYCKKCDIPMECTEYDTEYYYFCKKCFETATLKKEPTDKKLYTIEEIKAQDEAKAWYNFYRYPEFYPDPRRTKQ